MKHLYILFFVICACKDKVATQEKELVSGGVSASVFMNADSTFGYEIYQDSARMIRQTNIPAIPGNKGFEDKEQAERIANFVVYKLSNGIFPPTLTTSEIDSLLKIK